MAGWDDHPVHIAVTIGYNGRFTLLLSDLSLFYSRREERIMRRVSSLPSHLWEKGAYYAPQDPNYSPARAQGFLSGHPDGRVYAVYTSPCTRIHGCTQECIEWYIPG